MELQQYQNIYLYLKEQLLLTNLQITKEKQKFKNFSNQFQLKNNYIYKKGRRKPNNLLRVIRTFETELVLFMMHNDSTAGHFAVDKMFEKIRDRYYWPQMYETIKNYVQTYDSCQRRGKNKDNQLLHLIPMYRPFYQIGIDIVRSLPVTENRNKYIVVAIDYLMK